MALTAPVRLLGRGRFVALAAAAPGVLLLLHLLPATGPGLALRLAAASVCVLLVPGALVVRAVDWPASPALAIAASFALSLTVVALGVAFVFALGESIVLAGVVVAAVSVIAAIAAVVRGESRPVLKVERRVVIALVAASVPLACLVWWAAGPLVGDIHFHLARTQKLAEFDSLSTLSAINEFEDGGLHPGYAFPLLHGAEALIARSAGVDPVDVGVYLPAVLVPLALVLAYAAGSAVFQSLVGGLTLVVAQVAHVGFSRGDEFFEATGLFETLSQPQAASRLLLAPAVIALGFRFITEGGVTLLVSLTSAAFALSAIHVTYAPYVALIFGGFIAARVILLRGWDRSLTRGALSLGAILVPFGLILIVLLPVVRETRGVSWSAVDRAAQLDTGSNQFTVLGDWFGYSPSAIAREGPVVVAGLLAVPLAFFAARRLWAALVLGGSLTVLIVLLTPPLFTLLSDTFSVSQSRRLVGFLPIAFAVAGGCIVLSRLRIAGVAIGAVLGVAFVFLYPGDFARRFEEGGPEWAVVVSVVGGALALLAGAVIRPWGPKPGIWALTAAAAFAIPVSIRGLSEVERVRPMTELGPEIVDTVRTHVSPGDVVFSDPESAFQLAAFVPVYINAAPLGNVADTRENRPRLRANDSKQFFTSPSLTDTQRQNMLDRYGAGWVLLDKELYHPHKFLETLAQVFGDDRHTLYRVSG